MSEGCEQVAANPRGRKSVLWKRDPVILDRLRNVERQHLRGDTNVAIAAALGVAEATIRNDLKRLAELWLEQTKGAQETLRAQVVAELEDTRRRAIQAAEWDQMCERAVLFGDPVDDDDGNPVTVYRDAKGSAQFRGNKAAALGQARQASMDKAKVLGLVAEKHEVTGKDGAPLTFTIAIDRRDDDASDGSPNEM